jgi:hypothetical protein
MQAAHEANQHIDAVLQPPPCLLGYLKKGLAPFQEAKALAMGLSFQSHKLGFVGLSGTESLLEMLKGSVKRVRGLSARQKNEQFKGLLMGSVPDTPRNCS